MIKKRPDWRKTNLDGTGEQNGMSIRFWVRFWSGSGLPHCNEGTMRYDEALVAALPPLLL